MNLRGLLGYEDINQYIDKAYMMLYKKMLLLRGCSFIAQGN